MKSYYYIFNDKTKQNVLLAYTWVGVHCPYRPDALTTTLAMLPAARRMPQCASVATSRAGYRCVDLRERRFVRESLVFDAISTHPSNQPTCPGRKFVTEEPVPVLL